MHPHLIEWGPFSLSTYGVSMAVAFLLVISLTARATTTRLRGLVPMPAAAIADWGCWTILGGILGGRLVYILLNLEAYLANPWEIIAVWHGGLVWYGGFIGGVAATLWYLRRYRYPLWRGLDQVIPYVALGHAIGRIGCFLNGCCYGRPTTSWVGVTFPGMPGPVYPTQLFESASLFGLFLILRALQRGPILARPGLLFGIYLIAYGLLRWTLEFWRDNPHVIAGTFTVYQLMSLVVVAAGALLVALRLAGGRPEAAARSRA